MTLTIRLETPQNRIALKVWTILLPPVKLLKTEISLGAEHHRIAWFNEILWFHAVLWWQGLLLLHAVKLLAAAICWIKRFRDVSCLRIVTKRFDDAMRFHWIQRFNLNRWRAQGNHKADVPNNNRWLETALIYRGLLLVIMPAFSVGS